MNSGFGRAPWIGASAGGLVLFFLWITYGGGGLQDAGRIRGSALPAAEVRAREARQRPPSAPATNQILFGDLHVHTTFSMDAFLRSVPLLGGEGAHPPADACDFARYCSQLDFFALTDHAEMLTKRTWSETRESIRRCNAIGGGSDDPDLVAFTGFEWTQVGLTAEDHYGHRNVIFRHTDDARLPTRPISSGGLATRAMSGRPSPDLLLAIAKTPFLDYRNRDRYMDVLAFLREGSSVPPCPQGVDPRELPADCREMAETPDVLMDKLDTWGFDSLVIPHGMTWGFYSPPGHSWDKPIDPEMTDPERMRLIEIYSGHGNSEEYRPHRAILHGEEGNECPEPSETFEPCCHRAGELVRSQCGDLPEEACETRVREARRNYANAGLAGHLTVPWAEPEDWGECDQCTDCFQPTFNPRFRASVQYILARGNFDDEGAPYHLDLGFIASSDNHSARAGSGYKEVARFRMADVTGAVDRETFERIYGERPAPGPRSQPVNPEDIDPAHAVRLAPIERQSSFFLTGGLVAVHSAGRNREAIWEALEQRRVYATSGPRILLWFDLLDGSENAATMGEEVERSATPRFRVSAAGAFEQLPGCPEWAREGLDARRLERLCVGECYHPSDERHRITRIEVVRILPQEHEDEPIDTLIDDPFITLPCPPDQEICTVEFEDPSFAAAGRDASYYVRAIQEPTRALNAAGLRCDGSDPEQCEPCHGDYRGDPDDDCLAPTEQRAWSSPIYLRHDGHATPSTAP